ncbi:unnamed protein product, partial [Owenia fusiformis]
VNGNTDGSWTGGSCSHTYKDPNEQPWWIIDLGMSYNILKIVIWNRSSVGSRLHDFAVELSCEFDGVNADSPSWSRKYLQNGTLENNPTAIAFPESSVGRFIKIQNALDNESSHPSADTLSLCEFEVYAEYADCECEFGFNP